MDNRDVNNISWVIGKLLQISSLMLNYVYFRFELFLVLTHFIGDSQCSH